ncbi:hypothetical protein E2C01_080039 [Portunus trituberculatus]|uniref:Uncharacterized protein n=1 Tax=Portunus trituberculatus TaxID=210409 RepID=A0A5B7ISC9_PORTR|nr:hypothetical protein [Portunus trituberculatus]
MGQVRAPPPKCHPRHNAGQAAATAAGSLSTLTSLSLLLRIPLTKSVRFLSNIRSKLPLTFLNAIFEGRHTPDTRPTLATH